MAMRKNKRLNPLVVSITEKIDALLKLIHVSEERKKIRY